MLGRDWLTKSCPAQLWASRRYPGALGFLNLSHALLLPDRYGELGRFDTTPSRPSIQACSNTARPSTTNYLRAGARLEPEALASRPCDLHHDDDLSAIGAAVVNAEAAP